MVLVALCLVLITLGLSKPTESAQAILGFFLLFLLSLIVLNGTLEYPTGANISTTYGYTGDKVTSTSQTINDNYNTFSDTTSHNIGYYLAIASAIGMVGVFYSLRRSKRYD